VEAKPQTRLPMDLREYGLGAQILVDLGLKNHPPADQQPKKLVAWKAMGSRSSSRVPIRVPPNPHNAKYLRTKREKMGHAL